MILNTPDFNLEATLESGQVFGFEKSESGLYKGAICGRQIQIKQSNQMLEVQDVSPVIPARFRRPPALRAEGLGEESMSVDPRLKHSGMTEDLITRFFHLDFDLQPVYDILADDPRLEVLVKKLKGLRIIRQNFWEALACFIISANNNIKRIQKIRRNLVSEFSPSFQFPNPDQLAESSEQKLRQLGLGYRAPFLLNTAQMIVRDPELLNRISSESYAGAKMRLLEFPGVGQKVADCVLLFGIQKYEAFPVDTWILKAVRKLYFRNRSVPERKVQNFGQKRWKQYAGYIQQYLFHAAKSGMLEGN